MNKLKLFKAYGYDCKNRSPISFKLELRNVSKTKITNIYFKKVNLIYVTNIGQLLFGVPEHWRGLFEMKYKIYNNNTKADIDIYLDHRHMMFKDHINDIKKLIDESLNILKNNNIIEYYKK